MKCFFSCLTAWLLLSGGWVFAQTAEGEEKIEAAKVAMLTTRLNLTPNQAKSFWPLFNEYNTKRKAVRDANRALRKDLNDKVAKGSNREADYKPGVEKIINTRYEMGLIDKTYMPRFKQLLSYKQIAILYNTDQEFNRMLLRMLDENQPTTQKK